MTIFVIIVVVLIALYLFLIFPSPAAKKKGAFFDGKTYFAHRGLFNNMSIPENSMAAFVLAAEKNFGIELDVHITADGEIVVFHDDDLLRMCGVKGKIEEKTLSELRQLRLLNTDEKIPLLTEVLKALENTTPLIVEIKSLNLGAEVCEKTARILDDYDNWCVESFNPFCVRWFRKNRPNVVRGQLSCKFKKEGGFLLQLRNAALGNLLFNFISRPHFIAYNYKNKNRIAFKLQKLLGAVPVAWTVKSLSALGRIQNEFKVYICENLE